MNKKTTHSRTCWGGMDVVFEFPSPKSKQAKRGARVFAMKLIDAVLTEFDDE